jgi:hypothetical protein
MSDEQGWTSPSWDPTQRGGDDQDSAPSVPPPVPPPPPPGYAPPPPPPGYPPPPPPYGYGYGPGYGYGYQANQQVPKPGIIPLRPLGVGEILDGAVTVIRQHWKVMIGLSAAVVSVTGLIQFLLEITVLRSTSTPGSITFDTQDPYANQDLTGTQLSGFGGFIATSLLTWVATTLLAGLFTVIVSQAVLGHRATLVEAWAMVRPQFWRLIGLSIMSGLFIGLGAIFCVIPGIYLYAALAVSAPALILERGKVFGSMGRSRHLVTDKWWRTFGLLLLTLIISWIVSFVVEIPFLILGGGSILLGDLNSVDSNYVLLQALTAIGGIIAGAVTYPFAASVTTLMYVDLRMRKEGLDIELMRAAAA